MSDRNTLCQVLLMSHRLLSRHVPDTTDVSTHAGRVEFTAGGCGGTEPLIACLRRAGSQFHLLQYLRMIGELVKNDYFASSRSGESGCRYNPSVWVGRSADLMVRILSPRYRSSATFSENSAS